MQEDLPNPPVDAPAAGLGQDDVHNKLGLLTRQLHDALRELGYADRLRSSADKLPDAQNRLSYIARLTGEAAEKVLSLVDDAKVRQTNIVNATKQMRQSMIADPVAAVAKGHIMNYLEDMETATEIVDQQLTDIMMAQDFHDLTGQVIAKVVTLASSLESQLVELLVQTPRPVRCSQRRLPSPLRRRCLRRWMPKMSGPRRWRKASPLPIPSSMARWSIQPPPPTWCPPSPRWMICWPAWVFNVNR